MYVRNIQEVIEVKETTNRHEVNALVRDGWMLIAVVMPNSKHPEMLMFSLGKFPPHIDAAN